MGISDNDPQSHDNGARYCGKKLAKKHGAKYYEGPIQISDGGIIKAIIDGLFAKDDNVYTHEHKSKRKPKRAWDQTEPSRKIIGNRAVHTWLDDDMNIRTAYKDGDTGEEKCCYIITASSQDPKLHKSGEGIWGLRGDTPIWLNEQVISSKSFETLAAKIYPEATAVIKDFYDSIGPVAAEIIMNDNELKGQSREILEGVTKRQSYILGELHVQSQYASFVRQKYSPRTLVESGFIHGYTQASLEDILPVVEQPFDSSFLTPDREELEDYRRKFEEEAEAYYEDVDLERSNSIRKIAEMDDDFAKTLSVVDFSLTFMKDYNPGLYMATRDFYNAFFDISEKIIEKNPDAPQKFGDALVNPLRKLWDTLSGVPSDGFKREYIREAIHANYLK